jgi:hypothetical protein
MSTSAPQSGGRDLSAFDLSPNWMRSEPGTAVASKAMMRLVPRQKTQVGLGVDADEPIPPSGPLSLRPPPAAGRYSYINVRRETLSFLASPLRTKERTRHETLRLSDFGEIGRIDELDDVGTE